MARLLAALAALAATAAAWAPLQRPAGLRALPKTKAMNADWRSACEKEGVISYYDFGVRLGHTGPTAHGVDAGVDVTAAYLNSLAAAPARIKSARPQQIAHGDGAHDRSKPRGWIKPAS